VKKAPAGIRSESGPGGRDKEGVGTGREGGYDDAAYALVEASEEDLFVDCIGGFVKVKTVVVG
jgi:hypothetical protein